MFYPLVLAPGTLCDHRIWGGQSALGVSRKIYFADFTHGESIGAMAMNLLDAAPPRFALAGFSMGGIVALEAVRRAPGRITALALLSSNARPDASVDRAALIERAMAGELYQIIEKLTEKYFFSSPMEKTRTLIIKMGLALGPEVFRRQSLALASRPDSRPYLSQISVPTLIATGENDEICPTDRSVEMSNFIPDSRLYLIPRCGHMSPLEQPEAISRLLATWLESLEQE
jgi:pimeloyl-ACP methyl ester carboxylesterase